MVAYLTHHPKVKASNLATAPSTGRENNMNNDNLDTETEFFFLDLSENGFLIIGCQEDLFLFSVIKHFFEFKMIFLQ